MRCSSFRGGSASGAFGPAPLERLENAPAEFPYARREAPFLERLTQQLVFLLRPGQPDLELHEVATGKDLLSRIKLIEAWRRGQDRHRGRAEQVRRQPPRGRRRKP